VVAVSVAAVLTPLKRPARALIVVSVRAWCRVRVTGLEHVPRQGPVLLASNHQSFIDSVVIPVVVPRRVRFLAKDDYFTGTGARGWFNRTFFTVTGAVGVPRGAHADAKASLDVARGVLAAGDAFGIYPEGTRSRDGRLYRGRTGVAWLALTTGAPVVPVGLIGTDRAQPVGSKVLHPHQVTVRFAPALHPADYAHLPTVGQRRRAMTDDVMDAIAALTGQERAPRYAELPASALPAPPTG
jgi:1-acyl-sn-glycerol-3-phosphate acyltransferase